MNKGFTLIELLVSIGIVGILASLVLINIPRLEESNIEKEELVKKECLFNRLFNWGTVN